MKYLFVIPTLEHGGAEVVTINLCNEISKRGNDVYLMTFNLRGELQDRLNPQTKTINLNSNRARNCLIKLYFHLLFNKYDFVISMLTASNIITGLVFRLPFLNSKLIIRVAGLFENRDFPLFPNSLSKLVYYCAFSKKYKYIFNSKGSLESFTRYGVIDNTYTYNVIGNPVIDSTLQNLKNEAVDHPWFNENNKKFVIICVGRLNKIKDHFTLLKAFAIVIKSKVNARLLIIGDGPERENILTFISKNELNNYIDLIGFEQNPIKFMSRCSLFTLTSLSEGFGNVIVEALACKLNIIATNSPGGVIDILDNGKYGKLVNVGDYNELSKVIIDFMNNKYDFNKEMLLQRSQDFTVDVITNSYLEFIQK
jgi:glycosyltransferase involved in cell wall biosynthesis